MSKLLKIKGIIVCAVLLIVVMAQAGDDDNCAPANLRTGNWSTDFCQSAVDFDEILVGNPVKNGIPALSDPRLDSLAGCRAVAGGSVAGHRVGNRWRGARVSPGCADVA